MRRLTVTSVIATSLALGSMGSAEAGLRVLAAELSRNPVARSGTIWVTPAPDDARRIVEGLATASPDDDPAVRLDRFAGALERERAVVVTDVVRRRSGRLAVQVRRVDLLSGAAAVVADLVREPASTAGRAPARNRVLFGDTTVCSYQTTVYVPGKEECLEKVAAMEISQNIICANPLSRIPPTYNMCAVAKRIVDAQRAICDSLPTKVETFTVCTTVPDDTGEPKIEGAKQSAKEEVCKYRRPCEVS